ncbi:MAG TPA: efflux RND transporter periplasmic adaptor subunit [Bradyrhizobium sp.]|nr:efflux RND transporter periplasmic adaptor subunit [Bradyrhizobium sp.]
MNRAVLASTAVAALIAAAGGGFIAGRAPHQPAETSGMAVVTAAVAQTSGAPIYYQDPDGRPLYSLMPAKTPDGRDYRGVPASADISFEEVSAPETARSAPMDRKIKYYRNPMGLSDTSSTPKKDSMGMDYIPVYEDEDSEDVSVKLSPGKIQRTGVKSEPARRRAIKSTVKAPGTIQLDERRVSVVALRFEGFVETVADVTTGQHVHKGQPLMKVYSPALSSAAAEYLSALNAGTSGQPLKGARRRLENLGTPDAAIAELERTREISLSVSWPAPQDGEILERNAVNGMRAGPGDVLFRIADHRVVWVVIDVAERDLSQISVGSKVDVRPRAFQGQSFAGTVSLIYPHLNAQTRTARIRVEMPNPDELLRPDMYVDVDIDTGAPQPVLAVPESAVLDSGTRQAVFIDKGEGRFEPRDVKLGHRGDGYVEVREGISDGEPVVVSANFLIDAESNLKAALKGFSDAGAQP